jgi:hypothetical protein
VITAVDVDPARIEVTETVSARATVQDAETPAASLRYEWTADGGTFAGEGASVTWSPPSDVATPADFPLSLTVRETYASAGGQTEHRVSGTSAPVRVHDSPTEVREMSLRFLNCFADSSRSAEQCLVDFTDSCSGKESERRDIEENRKYYNIRSSSLRFNSVSISEGGMSARAVVSCEFRSQIRQCPPDLPGCVVGGTQRVTGECVLTATYEARRWWLCTSTFRGELLPLTSRFFGGE